MRIIFGLLSLFNLSTAVLAEDPPEIIPSAAKTKPSVPFPQAAPLKDTRPSPVIPPSRFATLKADFAAGELPDPQELRGAWIGRCFSPTYPNLPVRYSMIFDEVSEVAEPGLDDGPRFGDSQKPVSFGLHFYSLERSVTKDSMPADRLFTSLQNQHRENILAEPTADGWMSHPYQRSQTVKKYHGYWISQEKTTSGEVWMMCYFFKRALD